VVQHRFTEYSLSYNGCDKETGMDEVTVGDLDSNDKGSGARKSSGKPALDLIPVRIWFDRWERLHVLSPDQQWMLEALAGWQEGDTDALGEWLYNYPRCEYFMEAVSVLEFGAEKYNAWNWAKGMKWSVCVGCILRHTEKLSSGEMLDEDSGFNHWGHIIANVIFLVYYAEHYKEGDDRPPRY
jgi:hypothetical protein